MYEGAAILNYSWWKEHGWPRQLGPGGGLGGARKKVLIHGCFRLSALPLAIASRAATQQSLEKETAVTTGERRVATERALCDEQGARPGKAAEWAKYYFGEYLTFWLIAIKDHLVKKECKKRVRRDSSRQFFKGIFYGLGWRIAEVMRD